MKRILPFLTILVVLTSCGESRRENFTELDEDGNIVISEVSEGILREIQTDYDQCKKEESKDRECNRFTSEALCRFYDIDDFKVDDKYVTYREIKDVVTLKRWKLGIDWLRNGSGES